MAGTGTLTRRARDVVEERHEGVVSLARALRAGPELGSEGTETGRRVAEAFEAMRAEGVDGVPDRAGERRDAARRRSNRRPPAVAGPVARHDEAAVREPSDGDGGDYRSGTMPCPGPSMSTVGVRSTGATSSASRRLPSRST